MDSKTATSKHRCSTIEAGQEVINENGLTKPPSTKNQVFSGVKTDPTPTHNRSSGSTYTGPIATTRKSVEISPAALRADISGETNGARDTKNKETQLLRTIPTKAVDIKGGSTDRTTEKRRTKSMVDIGTLSGAKSLARQPVLVGGAAAQMAVQNFSYFLVLNFQATCDVHSKPQPQPREIMEFSLAMLNGQTFAIEAQFHQYVSPKINKKLSKFCTQLTSVSQCMVDGQPGLEATMKKLHVWIHEQGLYKPGITFAVVSHGDWDLQQLLPKNMVATSGSSIPDYFRKWIDISKIFKFRTGTDPSEALDELNGMLKMFNLTFEGPRHSGIYVCYNVIRIMRALATEKRCVFYINSLNIVLITSVAAGNL